MHRPTILSYIFFINDPATTEIYTLSLHDALPISPRTESIRARSSTSCAPSPAEAGSRPGSTTDRKSTRLNSSHQIISYAVFCLKKKNTNQSQTLQSRNQTFEFHEPLTPHPSKTQP